MGRRAVKHVGGFHQGFAQGGMGMDGEPQVGDIGPHFDGQGAFGDQFAGPAAHQADAEDALAVPGARAIW